MKNRRIRKVGKRRLTQLFLLEGRRPPSSVCKKCGLQLVPEWNSHVCPDKKLKEEERHVVFAFSKLAEREETSRIKDLPKDFIANEDEDITEISKVKKGGEKEDGGYLESEILEIF